MEDYYERKLRESDPVVRICWYCFLLTVAILIVAYLTSCSPRVVTVPEYHTEYINRTDTFILRDSIFTNTNTVIREANEGDSVLLAEYGIRLKDNERLLILLRSELQKATSEKLESHTDTVFRTDSVRVPYPVERKLSRWEQAKIDMGGWMFGIIIASVVALCVWLIRKKKII